MRRTDIYVLRQLGCAGDFDAFHEERMHLPQALQLQLRRHLDSNQMTSQSAILGV